MTTMFTPDHEWINIEDHEAAVVGITRACARRAGRRGVRRSARGRTHLQEGRSRRRRRSRSRPLPTCTCRSKAKSSRSTKCCARTPRSSTRDPMGNGWFFKVHVTHMEQFDAADGPARLRRAAQETLITAIAHVPDAMLMSARTPLAELEDDSLFATRHIGPDADEQRHMLSVIGAASRAGADRCRRAAQHRARRPRCGCRAAASEAQALAELKALAARNQVFKVVHRPGLPRHAARPA